MRPARQNHPTSLFVTASAIRHCCGSDKTTKILLFFNKNNDDSRLVRQNDQTHCFFSFFIIFQFHFRVPFVLMVRAYAALYSTRWSFCLARAWSFDKRSNCGTCCCGFVAQFSHNALIWRIGMRVIWYPFHSNDKQSDFAMSAAIEKQWSSATNRCPPRSQ